MENYGWLGELKDSLKDGNARQDGLLWLRRADKMLWLMIEFQRTIAVKLKSVDSSDLDREYTGGGPATRKINVDTVAEWKVSGKAIAVWGRKRILATSVDIAPIGAGYRWSIAVNTMRKRCSISTSRTQGQQ